MTTKAWAVGAAAMLLAAAGPAAPDDGYGNPYPADEVFARIARHELPAAIVHQDAEVMAFLDRAPWAEGHTLVIARTTPARSLIDIAPATLAKMMAVARRVMLAQRSALKADGAIVFMSNGNVQSVPHLHIHVIPTHKGKRIALDGQHSEVAPPLLTPVAARLAAAMPPAP